MNFDDLLQILKLGHQTARQAQEAHDRVAKLTEDACRRLDEDIREQRRIHDIVDLIDAEDALYDEAITALDQGDQDRALPLLELAAQAGIGEAAWLLAGVLEERGQTAEAIIWYRRAADDDGSHARVAEFYSHLASISRRWLPGQTGEPPAAPAGSGPHLSMEALPARFEPLRLYRCELDVAPFVLAETAAPPCDAARTLWAPHHGTGPDHWSVRAARVVFLEGPSDERVIWRLLTGHDRIKVVQANCLSAMPDFGRDAVQVRDHRLYLYQIKFAKTLLRHCQDSHRDSFFGGVIGGTVTSWQVEHMAAGRLTASDVMAPLASLTTLTPGTPVHHAMGQMLQAGTDTVLVCEEDQVVGMVTLADLARSVHDNRGTLSIERVETLMRPPATVGMAAPVSVVRALMARESTGLVIVSGPDSMTVGCITTQSLLTPETIRPHESSRTVPLLWPGKTVLTGCV